MLIDTDRPARPTARDLSQPAAISSRALRKEYGARVAVAGIDLDVRPGRITGFVGPNGAGKTTTIRMLLGLVRPTSGSATVLGAPVADPGAYLHRVGALIDGPAFLPALSGRANLAMLALLDGHQARIDTVLALVGLGDRGDDVVRGYSLGMRQRLGIAAALLPDPDLLVLDEPTNGLDPAGIREVRALLRGLADAGRTVFVSSHLLSEVETICDDLVVVRRGEVLYTGTMAGLLSAQRPGLVARPERGDRDLAALLTVASGLGLEAVVGDGELLVVAGPDRAGAFNRAAFAAGIVLSELRIDRPDLEDSFFALTESEGA